MINYSNFTHDLTRCQGGAWDGIGLEVVDAFRVQCPGCAVGRQGNQTTPLWVAANDGHTKTAKALLEAKCEVASNNYWELDCVACSKSAGK